MHDYRRVPLEMRFLLGTTNAYATATSIEDGSLVFAGVLVDTYDPATLDADVKAHEVVGCYIGNETMWFYVVHPPSMPSFYHWRSEKVPAAFGETASQPTQVTATIKTKPLRKVIGESARIFLGLPFTLAADLLTSPCQLGLWWLISNVR